jgi:tRNA U34 5-carboxymethylaminomethyl modifying GTPase MnmE/TrmE
VLLIIDRSQAWAPADDALAADWPNALRVFNKCDLPAAQEPPARPGLCISATNGTGLDSLLAAIAARLVPKPPPSGQGLPFLASHVQPLTVAREAVARADWAAARAALQIFAVRK